MPAHATDPDTTFAAYGWTPAVRRRLATPGTTGTPARVLRTDRGAAVVVDREGIRQVPLRPGTHPVPVAGDWALLGADGALTVLPRAAELARSDASGRQVLAANVGTVLVVVAADRPAEVGWMDRALVVAADGGAAPLLVLTKADLCADAESCAQRIAQRHPPVPVVTTSVRRPDGTAALRERLAPGATAALLGESGVGKSTLVNALAGRDLQATGAVRARDGEGRHTTVARHLVPIGQGTVVVDTPGLRAIGVVGLHAGLARTFPEVEAAARRCRFADCEHGHEPGCAVLDAVADGAITEDRLARYQRLRRLTAAPQRRPRRRR